MSDDERECPYGTDRTILTHMHYEQADGSTLVISAQQIRPDGTYDSNLDLLATTLIKMLLPSQEAEVAGREVLIAPFTKWVRDTIEYYGIDVAHAADRDEAYEMGVEL